MRNLILVSWDNQNARVLNQGDMDEIMRQIRERFDNPDSDRQIRERFDNPDSDEPIFVERGT